ncbi:tRNA and rRNA cytosine-C5-methylase (nucleolar protein NOL1/NOP2), partial [Pseudoloma neurophilia]
KKMTADSTLSPFLSGYLKSFFTEKELTFFIDHSFQKRPITIITNNLKINDNQLIGMLKRKGIIIEKIINNLYIVKEENNLPIGATTEYLNGFYYKMGVSSAYAIFSLKNHILSLFSQNEKHGEAKVTESDVTTHSVNNDDIEAKDTAVKKDSVNNDDIEAKDTVKKNTVVKHDEIKNTAVKHDEGKDTLKKNTAVKHDEANHSSKRQKKAIRKPLNILDMCAAPGGKAILLYQLLNTVNSDCNVSFYCLDNNEKRCRSMAANFIRMDVPATVICDDALVACGQTHLVKNEGSKTVSQNKNTSKDKKSSQNKKSSQDKTTSKDKTTSQDKNSSENRRAYLPKMDIVLLDAPCSGTGTLSKDPQAALLDNPKLHQLIDLQRKLIINGFDNLKSNGLLFYSTCSILMEENEEIVDYLLKQRKSAKLEVIDGIGQIGKKAYRGKQFSNDMIKARRIYPHTHNGDGFFYCLIRKCN